MSTTRLTTHIVAAFVEGNPISAAELPGLISTVDRTLQGLGNEAPTEAPQTEMKTKAEIKRSIRPEGLTSFLDGKTYKSMKRHLATHGLTPAQYRERFGLPDDYPMVSALYSAARSAMAKALGLGQMGRAAAKAKPVAKAKPNARARAKAAAT